MLGCPLPAGLVRCRQAALAQPALILVPAVGAQVDAASTATGMRSLICGRPNPDTGEQPMSSPARKACGRQISLAHPITGGKRAARNLPAPRAYSLLPCLLSHVQPTRTTSAT